MTDTETVTGEVVGKFKGVEGWELSLDPEHTYKLVRVSDDE